MAFAVSEGLHAVPYTVSPISIEISRRVGELMRELGRLNTTTTIDTPPAPLEAAPYSSEAGPGDVVDIRV